MKIHSFKSAYPPPPPPSMPSGKTGKGINKGLLAAILIVVIVVATVIPLVALNIIPLRPNANSSPSPTNSPTFTAAPSASPSHFPTPTPTGTPSTVTYGVLIGTAVDTSGNPLADVTVTIGGKTGTTNSQGWFSVANIAPGNKQTAKFSKTYFASTYQVTSILQGESSFVVATLKPVDKTETFDATQGTTIKNTAGNSQVTINANSLNTRLGALFNGVAKVSLTTFDPSNENDANAFPGEYIGQAENQTSAPIKSFGFMDVSFTDQNGEELQLASGKTATLSIHVPSVMQTEAATMGTCPLWYYDTSNGIWQQEGQGTYNAGTGSFAGTVSHFSTWNFDVMYPRAYISGRVVDSNGNPVWGAQVKCWGTGWVNQRWVSGETITNDNGVFIKIPVESGVTFKYQASKGGHQSTILSASPLEPNQEYNVGDIILDAPLIQITLTWGLNPRDLDSHLAAKLTIGTTLHVYYGDEGSLTSPPYANLDTDETHSYGPEVISISKLQPGTYRYSVRHYTGDGAISTSGAEVNVVIPNIGIYKFTAPTTQPSGTDIWRVFEIVIDSTGKVTAVNTINDYVTGGDESTLLFPP
jgi:hypothetical protein